MKRQRAIYKSDLQVREIRGDSGNLARLEGLAVPYNTLSVDLGGFREMFLPGAFRDFETEDIYAAPHHDSRQIIGRASAGTLRLDDRDEGLYFEVDLPDTTAAKDLVESVRRGDITGNSFTFSIDGSDEESVEFVEEDGQWIQRVLSGATLFEVAPGVVSPAYQQTEIDLVERSFSAWSERQARLIEARGEPIDHDMRLRERERELIIKGR